MLKKLQDSEFCSAEHRDAFQQQQTNLALSRLMDSQRKISKPGNRGSAPAPAAKRAASSGPRIRKLLKEEPPVAGLVPAGRQELGVDTQRVLRCAAEITLAGGVVHLPEPENRIGLARGAVRLLGWAPALTDWKSAGRMCGRSRARLLVKPPRLHGAPLWELPFRAGLLPVPIPSADVNVLRRAGFSPWAVAAEPAAFPRVEGISLEMLEIAWPELPEPAAGPEQIPSPARPVAEPVEAEPSWASLVPLPSGVVDSLRVRRMRWAAHRAQRIRHTAAPGVPHLRSRAPMRAPLRVNALMSVSWPAARPGGRVASPIAPLPISPARSGRRAPQTGGLSREAGGWDRLRGLLGVVTPSCGGTSVAAAVKVAPVPVSSEPVGPVMQGGPRTGLPTSTTRALALPPAIGEGGERRRKAVLPVILPAASGAETPLSPASASRAKPPEVPLVAGLLRLISTTPPAGWAAPGLRATHAQDLRFSPSEMPAWPSSGLAAAPPDELAPSPHCEEGDGIGETVELLPAVELAAAEPAQQPPAPPFHTRILPPMLQRPSAWHSTPRLDPLRMPGAALDGPVVPALRLAPDLVHEGNLVPGFARNHFLGGWKGMSQRLPGATFWRHAPSDLKMLGIGLPLVVFLVIYSVMPSQAPVSGPQVAPPAAEEPAALAQAPAAEEPVAPAVPVPVAATPARRTAPGGRMAAFQQAIQARAAIDYIDDFRSGLGAWTGDGGWARTWKYDKAQFVEPGQLALYSPTLPLADYSLEFLGQIGRRGLSWVFRAKDLKNYYVMRLVLTKNGALTQGSITRFAVVDGRKGPEKTLPIPMPIHQDALLRVRTDVRGHNFTTWIQEQVVDNFSDERIERGGVGFFSLPGDRALLRWVEVKHQYDFLGRLCAMLAPYSVQADGRTTE